MVVKKLRHKVAQVVERKDLYFELESMALPDIKRHSSSRHSSVSLQSIDYSLPVCTCVLLFQIRFIKIL